MHKFLRALANTQNQYAKKNNTDRIDLVVFSETNIFVQLRPSPQFHVTVGVLSDCEEKIGRAHLKTFNPRSLSS